MNEFPFTLLNLFSIPAIFSNPSTCTLYSRYPGRLLLSIPAILQQSINLYTVQSLPWPSLPFHPNHPSTIHQPIHCTAFTLAVSSFPSQPSLNNPSTCTLYSVQPLPWPSLPFHPNHPSTIHQPIHCTVSILAVSLLSCNPSNCTVPSRLFLSIPTISLAIHSCRLFISI